MSLPRVSRGGFHVALFYVGAPLPELHIGGDAAFAVNDLIHALKRHADVRRKGALRNAQRLQKFLTQDFTRVSGYVLLW